MSEPLRDIPGSAGPLEVLMDLPAGTPRAAQTQVTSVMIGLTAYNIMRLLHELQTERARVAFART